MANDPSVKAPVMDAAGAPPAGEEGDPRDLSPVIDDLMQAARAAVALGSAAGMQAARDLLVSAAELKQRLPGPARTAHPWQIELTPEEWQKRFKPTT